MSEVPYGGLGPVPLQDTVHQQSSTIHRPANSYAERAKMNVKFDQRLKRNVLEIEVEKLDGKDEIFLSQEVIANLLNNIGMNHSTEMEGYQVSYGGRSGKIAVLCKTGVNLDRFCSEDIELIKDSRSTQVILGPGPNKSVISNTMEILDFLTTQKYVYPDRKKCKVIQTLNPN